jgi:hypothetical protein
MKREAIRDGVIFGVVVVLSGCAGQRAEPAGLCSAPGWTAIETPPADVAALYQTAHGLRGPRYGYHEHWYQSDDGSVELCRHPASSQSGCATETARFARTPDGWKPPDIVAVTICGSGRTAGHT